jgi:hypothetical protein
VNALGCKAVDRKNRVFCTLMLVMLVLFTASVGIPAAYAELSEQQKATLSAIARAEPVTTWQELTCAQARALNQKAETYMDIFRQYHHQYYQVATVWFTDYGRTDEYLLDGIGDSTHWTGHHLAALAHRYSATGEVSLLNEINHVVDAFDLLTLVHGRDGYLARYVGPLSDPAYERYYRVYGGGEDPTRPGFGKWAYLGVGPYTDQVWLGNSSRDTYTGAILGLVTAYRLVPDLGIRARVQTICQRVVDRLISDSWYINDGKGHLTSTTMDVKAGWLQLAALGDPSKYGALYNTYAAQVMAAAAPSMPKYGDYYPNNLSWDRIYALATLETDPVKKANYVGKIATMWSRCTDHLNAYFAALYMSATGDTSNVVARATIQGNLYDFREPPNWMQFVDNSTRTDIEFITYSGKTYAKYALPMRERIWEDFCWQRSPGRLRGGTTTSYEHPGLDMFQPYWIAVECGVIVVDRTPPSITAPPDVEVAESDPLGTAVDLGQPTVSDACDPNPTVENNAPAVFPLGSTTVTWTATDLFNNVAAAQQMVTVVPGSPQNQLGNLRKLAQIRVASGQIEAEMQVSLLAKVDAAIAALARGNPNDAKAAMGELKALVNQVEAQTDKKIDPAVAAEIIARANRIIAALAG